MITEDYVSFEIAKLLKEKGFDEFCEYEYGVPKVDGGYVLQRFFKLIKNSDLIDEAYTAPTLQMAMKWLREKHIVVIPEVETFYADGSVSSWEYHIWCDDNYEEEQHSFSSYEEACETAIKYCLENLI